MTAAGITPAEIAAVGITNQRETTVLWERATGRPIGNAIVWQCRRTAALCDRLRAEGAEPEIRRKTGLVVDAYFSGTKIRWMLDHDPALRPRAERGELCFGTVDSWLLWQLTGGRVHATDPSNASRTLCYDIHALAWDEGLCRILGVPMALLPEVKPSAGVFGETAAGPLPAGIPVTGIAGDQQAALFGQACVEPGMAKNTYGTGCFALLNTGPRAVASAEGLLTTVAWTVEGATAYALEGAVFIAGAAVQWLRDGLGIIKQAAETEALARSVADTGGVYLVPAFVGLGAPYWDPYARGTLVGITRGTTRAHLARATLEAIAYQSRDVLDTMKRESGVPLSHAAGRRRRGGQRLPLPVPGRRAGSRGAAPLGDRDHRARRGLPGRSGRRAVEEPGPRRPLEARAQVHPRHVARRARGRVRGLAPRGGAGARLGRARAAHVLAGRLCT